MCTVRPATPEDIEPLVSMGVRFFAYSAFSKFTAFDADSVRQTLAGLIAAPSGLVLVAVEGDAIVGALVATVGNYLWFNQGVRCATELAWWVSDDHRGGRAGILLYRAFEAWAAEQGAQVQAMSDLVIEGDAPAGKLFDKLGLTVVERAHIKGV